MSTHDTFTSSIPVTVPPSAEASGVDVPMERVHRFTVEQYHRMAEAGVFHPEERVELIEGIIVEMTPIGLAHRFAVDQLTQLLVPTVAIQSPFNGANRNPILPSFAANPPTTEIDIRDQTISDC
jgi:hypothetical protein